MIDGCQYYACEGCRAIYYNKIEHPWCPKCHSIGEPAIAIGLMAAKCGSGNCMIVSRKEWDAVNHDITKLEVA